MSRNPAQPAYPVAPAPEPARRPRSVTGIGRPGGVHGIAGWSTLESVGPDGWTVAENGA